MDLKKSLFGGYKRDSVDAAIKQLNENEEQYQAKIALLDNEFRLSKEAAQKNLESIQTELVIRQKSLSDLTRTLDEKNTRIAELEERQRTIIAEFERQYGAIISEMKEKQDTAIEKMEEKYNAKIAGLQERYRQETISVRQNDDQVRRIGQLYVDAQEYTEKMKTEAKNKMMEAIDIVFSELSKTQERFEESFTQISQKKANLNKLAGEMLESLRSLQNKMDSMDHEQVNIASSFENIKYTKEQIKRNIQNEYDKDREKEKRNDQPLQKAETMAKAPSYEKIAEITNQEQSTVPTALTEPAALTELTTPAVPVAPVALIEPAEPAAVPARPDAPVDPIVNYAAQIEELKQKIERQERLLFLRNREVDSAKESGSLDNVSSLPAPSATVAPSTPAVPSIPAAPSVPAVPRFENKSIYMDTPSDATQPVPETDVEISNRNEKEKEYSERENYSRYFEEISKKYSKEQQPAPAGTVTPASLPEEFMEPVPAADNKDEAENTENPVSKKPSIKDILNKYANLK